MPLAPASPDGGAAFSLKTKKMGDTGFEPATPRV